MKGPVHVYLRMIHDCLHTTFIELFVFPFLDSLMITLLILKHLHILMHCYPSITGNFQIKKYTGNLPAVNQICYLHGMYYSLWFGGCVCQGTGGAGYRGMLVTAILPHRCTSLLRGQKTLLFKITMMFFIFYDSSCGTEIHQYLQLNVSFTINVRLKHPLHLQICSHISKLLKHLLQTKYKKFFTTGFTGEPFNCRWDGGFGDCLSGFENLCPDFCKTFVYNN